MTHPDNLLDQPVYVYDDYRADPVTAGILRRFRHGVYWIQARAPYYTMIWETPFWWHGTRRCAPTWGSLPTPGWLTKWRAGRGFE